LLAFIFSWGKKGPLSERVVHKDNGLKLEKVMIAGLPNSLNIDRLYLFQVWFLKSQEP
jgi:hypothetical protein